MAVLEHRSKPSRMDSPEEPSDPMEAHATTAAA